MHKTSKKVMKFSFYDKDLTPPSPPLFDKEKSEIAKVQKQ